MRSSSYSPYSRSGCTATATFDSSVHGVVVHTTSWRLGSVASGKVTNTEFVCTSSLAQRQLVGAERGAAARAVRQHLVATVEERLVVQPLQEPPHRLDVLGRVGDVGALVVEPVGDPLGEIFPVRLVREHVLAAQRVELLDAERLDLLLAADVQLLLDLDLDRQAVRVPARDARDAVPEHRLIAAHQVLDGA